jgi:rifampicin phosphotransferase
VSGAPWILPLAEARDASRVGGKAVNLAAMLAAGLPVPDAFVVTTAAFRLAADDGTMPSELAAEIAAAYRSLGAALVAVRSSATAEDLPDASMAGQYETVLDVQGEEQLRAAVECCWASLKAARLESYLRRHGIDPASVNVAVVVQAMVSADVAGVLFTANPQNGRRDEMVVEASWGLGEAVVSGLVQPDRIVLDRRSGAVRDYAVADKRVWIAPGAHRLEDTAGDGGATGAASPVPDERRRVACLSAEALAQLWQLGRKAAEHFGAEQDVEWAIAGGQVFLLQSRAITTLAEGEARASCLRAAREQLRRAADEGRGDWVRHNLSETLPHPTPLSWSVLRRFMSGEGGFGGLYRRAGFEPSEPACRDGFLDLVAGRVYMDLSRAGGMFFEGFPFRYDVDLLRVNPDAAQQPPTLPAGSLGQRLRAARRLAGVQCHLEELAADCDRRLDEQITPELVAWVEAERQRDLTALSAAEWIELWRRRESRVMDRFAPEALLPSLIAAMALERLRAFLAAHFWDERPDELLDALAVGDRAGQTLRASQGLYDLARGRLALDAWLAEHGHRGPEEFDLAAPRWRERPAEVAAMARGLADAEVAPEVLHRRRLQTARATAGRLAARLSRGDRREFVALVALVGRYLRFREDGKHWLMLGYELLRDLAREADRKLRLGDDVFLLCFDELCDALRTGEPPHEEIQRRRAARRAEARLRLPPLIARDEIDALGDERPPSGGARLPAVAVSSGVCTAAARIVLHPDEAGEFAQGSVLVCPSTDPSWTPLMIQSAGLVLERGGMLSHGAVVARELGLPAVVLPDATRILRDGETVTVDGRDGAVLRAEPGRRDDGTPAEDSASEDEPTRATDDQRAEPVDPRDVRVPAEWIPPPPGPRERRAARLRTAGLVFWGALLGAVFLLPPDVLHDPAIRLLDRVLWPLVAGLGRPGAVAALAVGLALATLVSQRVLTDNRRLAEAGRRAKRLRREAARLPADSPRRRALLRLAAPVQSRLLGAAMVPIALVLGPLVMTFAWLPLRVDPASRNAKLGAVFFLTAEIDGEHRGTVGLNHDSRLALDPDTPAAQTIPPVRPVLEELLAQLQAGGGLFEDGDGRLDDSANMKPAPAESTAPAPDDEAAPAPAVVPEIPPEMMADLAAYLEGPPPPQSLAWTLRAPAGVADRFEVQVTGGDASAHGAPVPALVVPLVAGDRYPPELKEDLGDRRRPVQVVRPPPAARSPIESVRVAFLDRQTADDDVFWRPLGALGWPALEASRWAAWDAGWLLTYLAAYLAALFPLRWLLGVA